MQLTLLKTNISPPKVTLEDDLPFPKGGICQFPAWMSEASKWLANGL